MNYIPNHIKNILDKFQKADYQIYIVGGAVRDLLMKKEVKDWDFTTDAKPEEILKLFPDGFYDNKFGTVGIPSSDGLLEITTMRKEGVYKDFRHPSEVSWTSKIEEDLARRDFTINAIAMSEIEGQTKIIDPYQGQADIKNKTIHCVGEPSKRFQEDALRLIRAIRFSAQLNFEINKETFAAIKQNCKLISEIAWERIRDELFKILISENAYESIVKLRQSGLLQIILPEVERCFGIVQKGPKHARVYDIGEHSFLTLKHIPSSEAVTRFAALLHDIGKVDTIKIEKDGNITFYQHDVVGSDLAKKIAQRFNLSNKQTDKLYKLVRWHMFSVSENQTDSAIRRFIRNVGIENIEDMMALRIGDRLGGGTEKETSWRMEEFKKKIKKVLKKPFSIADLKINGNDVMKQLKITPGPKVGEILEALFQEVLKDSNKNNREYLLERIKTI